jgi:hypothetical protein
LGAAVANLIPVQPWQGKFPSHNYKPGDIIPIDFTIAPRVIDQVKEAAPNTHLFGFKLLKGVDLEELIRAAYEVLLSSKATTIFANDATDLKTVYAVTKERGVHKLQREVVAQWVYDMINDEYYHTDVQPGGLPASYADEIRSIVRQHADQFKEVQGGYVFGTVAKRFPDGFMTTARGKSELEDWSFVQNVNHDSLTVRACHKKATLNAPLLDRIFQNEKVQVIVHAHHHDESLPTQAYAPAGTVRDVERDVSTSFNVEGHGYYHLYDENGGLL